MMRVVGGTILLCLILGCGKREQPGWHFWAALTNRTDVTPGVTVRELPAPAGSDAYFLVELPEKSTYTLLQLGVGMSRAEDRAQVGIDRTGALEIRDGTIRPLFGRDLNCVWQNPSPCKITLVFLKEHDSDRYYGVVTIELATTGLCPGTSPTTANRDLAAPAPSVAANRE
jgi:hypothetical protein